jgi:hypothetical protein
MSLPLVGADEVLDGAVIGALGFRRKKTAGQLAVAAVVVHAVATGAFAGAGFVGAGAAPGIGVFFTFHDSRFTLGTILSKLAAWGGGGWQKTKKPSILYPRDKGPGFSGAELWKANLKSLLIWWRSAFSCSRWEGFLRSYMWA